MSSSFIINFFYRKIFLLSILIISFTLIPFSKAELVTDLPDYPYRGKMFSGYLNLANPDKKLHYIFVESENDPSLDPVLLWLNGGPGCSSLLGWAQEHGPAVFKKMSTKWKLNDYSWNKKANVIYLESPAGVGFSYIDSKNDFDWETNDETSAMQNLEAVLNFFKNFPNLKRNDFYISGESYAGIYVPFLASKILEYNKRTPEVDKVMLKGILVGNGVTDWKYDTTPALLEFGFTHAIYSPELRNKYIRVCSNSQNDPECKQVEEEIIKSFEKINIYDIYRTCVNSNNSTDNKNNISTLSILDEEYIDNKNVISNKKNKFQYTPWVMKRKDDINSNSKKNYSSTFNQSQNEDNLKSTPPCVDSVGPDNFFNRPEVKSALYVKNEIKWEMCSDRVESNYQIDNEKGSFFLYKDLIASGLRILIYSGDTDASVPFNGTIKWIKNLNLVITNKWRSWRINNNQIAGYIENYQGLTFVTVKGTGHMAPQWKRPEAFYMLNQFLDGKDL